MAKQLSKRKDPTDTITIVIDCLSSIDENNMTQAERQIASHLIYAGYAEWDYRGEHEIYLKVASEK